MNLLVNLVQHDPGNYPILEPVWKSNMVSEPMVVARLQEMIQVFDQKDQETKAKKEYAW